MKKILSVILMALVALSVSGQEKKVKTGWKFNGALPATTYDSNLGFQYGALVEFNNYGDGSTYPDYFDHTYTEISHYTKGSGIFRMMYESNHLIKGIHLTSDLSYLPDAATDFYGFNGYESVYNSDWEKYDKATGPVDPYRSADFYRFKRNEFRFKNDFQGKLSGEHIKWSAGFAIQDFIIDTVNIPKLNKGRKDKLPFNADMPGLFDLYKALGLITSNEANGGWVNIIKAGIAWDSRDNRPNPMKGIWTEMGVEIAPKFLGNDWGFSRFYITHRQYFTLVEKNLALVYRLDYQTTISGKVPFFYQSQFITSMLTGATSEGLGGSSTLRGVLRNRVIGDGFFMGNVELRWKPIYFKFFKQDCYLGLNAFYDFGLVTKDITLPSNLSSTFLPKIIAVYPTEFIVHPTEQYSDFFHGGKDKLHQSAGISILPVMNQSFVICVDIGKAFNAQDGNIGFSIGLNYLF